MDALYALDGAWRPYAKDTHMATMASMHGV